MSIHNKDRQRLCSRFNAQTFRKQILLIRKVVNPGKIEELMLTIAIIGVQCSRLRMCWSCEVPGHRAYECSRGEGKKGYRNSNEARFLHWERKDNLPMKRRVGQDRKKKEKERKGFGNLPNETIGQIMLVNGETCRFLVLNSQSMVCPSRSQM